MRNIKIHKFFKFLIVIVLLGIIVVYCGKRWNAWFKNPDEPQYTINNTPERIKLTLSNEGQFSRIVSWQCGDSLEISQLLLVKTASTDTVSISAAGKILPTQGGVTVSYHAKLTGLTEGEYSYCVSTGDKQSGWYNFSLSSENNFRFVYIGDIQDKIGGSVKNLFTLINQKEKDIDFWALGGDVIECPHDMYWNEYFTSFDSIIQTTPVIACPGNHEFFKGLSNKLDERFIYNFPYFIESQTKGNAVFETRYGNAAIITLDSNSDSWTLFSQRNWFKQALQKAEDAKWKIVILHHPLYSVRGKFRNYFIRRMFDPLIREFNVDLVLQGHEHCYARMINKDNNSFSTPVYVISQASPKNYKINFDGKYDRFGVEQRFYQTIDVKQDTLSLKTFTEKGELFDSVLIVKPDGTQMTRIGRIFTDFTK